MNDTVTLFCVVNGDDPTDRTFPVKIEKTNTVGELKELIKTKKCPEFDDTVADSLTLWKVDISQDALASLEPDFDYVTENSKLSPLSTISEVFPEGPADKHLHIIVVRPAIAPVQNQMAFLQKRIEEQQMKLEEQQVKINKLKKKQKQGTKRKRVGTDDGENDSDEGRKIIRLSNVKLRWHVRCEKNGGDVRRQHLINSVIEQCGGKRRKISFACVRGQRDVRDVLDRIENKRLTREPFSPLVNKFTV